MKRFTLFLLIASAIASTATAKDWNFPPPLEEIIEKYSDTVRPDLPESEDLAELENQISVAPAKLRMTRNIMIDKKRTRLFVTNCFGDTLASYPVCCSRNMGQKKKTDDCRTPEGDFSIIGVYNSTDWRYKGTGAKCYGPFFISVNTKPFYGIGIHGTNAPGSVPGRHSHGCIRMHNEDIVVVRKLVDKDSRILILPDDNASYAKATREVREKYIPPTRRKK